MEKAKKLILAGSILAALATSLGGCFYTVSGPYPLVTFHRPSDYYRRDGRDGRDCRYYRDCY